MLRGCADRHFIPDTPAVKDKIHHYTDKMNDYELSQKPVGCEYSNLRLMIGQFRHWHRHMGIIYGFIVADTGKWPYVLNRNGK